MEDALSIFLVSPKSATAYNINIEGLVDQVSGRLYKVHRYLLSQSVAFRDMFTCPPGPNAMVQGETDADPITLQGVTHEEFEALLDVLYDRYNARL